MGLEMNLSLFKNPINFWSLYLSNAKSPKLRWKLPNLQAHRGYWIKSQKQNTLESLRDAKDCGYQMAEIDVQITKDGVPVLFHDFNLRNQLKKNVKINELNFKDLNQLIGLSRLEDVLLSKERPVFLNIEIKSDRFFSEKAEGVIAKVIKSTKSMDQVIISSFNHWSLIKFKNSLPEVPRALLITNEKETWNYGYLNKMWLLSLVQPSLIHLNYSMLESELISLIKERQLLIAAWTVNDLNRAKKLLNVGVDSIITDSILPRDVF